MEQFPNGGEGVKLLDRLGTVCGLIPQAGDDPGLAEERLAGQALEGRLVNEGAQVILIGEFQRGVMLVEPCHGQFQRPAGVKAGRARIGEDRTLGLGGGFEKWGPLELKEGEVGHGIYLSLSTWRCSVAMALLQPIATHCNRLQ